MLGRFFTFFPQKRNLVGLSREQCGYTNGHLPQAWSKPKKKDGEEWVFSFDSKLVGYPVAFAEAYADQNFCAFIQNDEPGSPSLLFRRQMANRIQPTARLKGMVFKVPTARLDFLDMIYGNTVECNRRKTRVLLPLKKENGVMLNVPVWMYHDDPEKWRDRFHFDYEMSRGRQGSFEPAKLDYNPRFPHIEKYYVHPWMKKTEGLDEERGNAARQAQRNNKPASTLS